MKIFTIGHSDHSKERLLEMLWYASIESVIDVRAFPASRKHPQFKKDNMETWLKESGIAYRHCPLLGGRRSRSGTVADELNAGWKNQSFHNYADYALTDDFREGLHQLKSDAEKKRAVYMCSERHPARCHRMIISNQLQADGWDVQHIIEGTEGKTELAGHKLGRWGAMPIIEETGDVVYPKIGE